MRYFLLTGFLTVVIIVISIAFTSRPQPTYDILLRNGTIYDGSGSSPFVGDIAIQGDTIAAMGNLKDVQARKEIDVTGLAVTPGFINMLSWADRSLLMDGRSIQLLST